MTRLDVLNLDWKLELQIGAQYGLSIELTIVTDPRTDGQPDRSTTLYLAGATLADLELIVTRALEFVTQPVTQPDHSPVTRSRSRDTGT